MYYALFGLVLALVLGVVAWGVYRAASQVMSHDASHRAYARLLRDELKAERELLLRSLQRGELSAHQFQAKEEGLAQRLLDERAMDEPLPETEPRWVKTTAAVCTFVLAAGVAVIYPYVGDASSLSENAMDQRAAIEATVQSSSSYQETISTLEALVKKDPKNADAWLILAQHYQDTNDFAQAVMALEALHRLEPKNVKVLSDLLEMTIAEQNGALTGNVATWVKEGLVLDPMAPNFLLVAAPLAQDKGDFKEEAIYWRRLLALIPPLDPAYDVINQRLGAALKAAGLSETPQDPVLEKALKAQAGKKNPHQSEVK